MIAAPRWSRFAGRAGHLLVIGGFTAFLALPFYWMLITAFKRTNDLLDLNNNPFLFNLPPTLENLRVLFAETQFGRWVLNTVGVGAAVTAITLVLAVPAGYALARVSGRWGHRLGVAI